MPEWSIGILSILLFFVGPALTFWVIGKIFSALWGLGRKKMYKQVKRDLDHIINDAKQEAEKYKGEADRLKKELEELEANLSDRGRSYKWLAPLIADIKMALKERERPELELVTSKRPPETRAKVNVLKHEIKCLEEENITLKYHLNYIKTLIPEAEDIIEYDEFRAEDEDADAPHHFLSKEEYNSLPEREKNERALKHYMLRKKKKWEIGRDFERFIGYEYECLGYEVEYFGIEKRFEDLGRDLIVAKDNNIFIIQCKYWSRDKTIHEKHIAQLYGTVIMYELGMDESFLPRMVRGLFITHAKLSSEAKRFAKRLRVEIVEDKELGEYPLIKCNVSKRNGEITRIYHLPMDQQYDTTKIDQPNGDCYAFTIEEAEAKGFRRAFRWHGD